MLASRTDGRARTGTRCRARSRCRARAPAPPGAGSRRACRAAGWIALWPPSAAPIAHGLPTSSGAGVERVVRPLRLLAADRMDRRQVERRRSPCSATYGRRASHVVEACRARPGSRRAERGKNSYQLEKRARSRSTTTRELALVGAPRARGRDSAARSPRAPRRARCACSSLGVAARRAGCLPHRAQPLRVVARGARSPLRAISVGADAARRCDVGGVDAAREARAPGQEVIDPRRDRVAIAAELRRPERRRASGRCRAASSAASCHVGVVSWRQQQHAREHVVAVGEAVGLDDDALADDALDGEAPAVDLRA